MAKSTDVNILSKFVKNMQDARLERGYLGEPVARGQYRFKSRTRPNLWRVRLMRNDQIVSIVDAINTQVPENPQVRVILDQNADGIWEVRGVDPTYILDQAGMPGIGVGPHSHRLGGGLEDLVEARRFEPGLVMAQSSMSVYVWPFAYRYGGSDDYFEGGSIDLTAYRPATSGAWQWCKVGIDPASNTLVADNTGASEFTERELMTIPDLMSIDFTAYIPLAGVRLTEGMTAVNEEKYLLDLRNFPSSGGIDTSQFVLTAPGSAGRNDVQATGDFPGLRVLANPTQTANIFEVLDTSGTTVFKIDEDGDVGMDIYQAGQTMQANWLKLGGHSFVTVKTIASGAVTLDMSYCAIDAESGTTDDLNTINIPTHPGKVAYMIVTADFGDSITFKHGVDNIDVSTGADFTLTENTLATIAHDGVTAHVLPWSEVGGGGGGDYDYVDVLFVSQDGNDANDGKSPDQAKLTIGAALTAASALTPSSTNRITIKVLDAATYVENISMVRFVSLDASAAILQGSIDLTSDSFAVFDKHYPSASNQQMINKTGGFGHGFYKANVVDGGQGGYTGVTCVRNVSNGSVLFAYIGVMYVSASGYGISDDVNGFGHIHFWSPEIYLDGNNAVGIYTGSNSSNFIGYIDHILRVELYTGCTAIWCQNSSAIIKASVNEIIMTANNAIYCGAGNIHLTATRLIGDITTSAGATLHVNSPHHSGGTLTNNGTINGVLGTAIYNLAHDHEDAEGGGTLASAATPSAIHDDTAGEIAALTEKLSPASGDWLLIEDSAASNVKKKAQVGNIGGGSIVGTVSTSQYHSPTRYSSTSTSYVDVDATNLAITINLTGGGLVKVEFVARVSVGSPAIGSFRITDGTNHGHDNNYDIGTDTTVTAVFTGLPSGSTTFKLQYKSSRSDRLVLLFESPVMMTVYEIA